MNVERHIRADMERVRAVAQGCSPSAVHVLCIIGRTQGGETVILGGKTKRIGTENGKIGFRNIVVRSCTLLRTAKSIEQISKQQTASSLKYNIRASRMSSVFRGSFSTKTWSGSSTVGRFVKILICTTGFHTRPLNLR